MKSKRTRPLFLGHMKAFIWEGGEGRRIRRKFKRFLISYGEWAKDVILLDLHNTIMFIDSHYILILSTLPEHFYCITTPFYPF